jgi:hypothetical protein
MDTSVTIQQAAPVFQIVLILGLGLACFSLGYAVRAAISQHRRAKTLGARSAGGRAQSW